LPPPREVRKSDDYFPFNDEEEFQFANFLYTREQMSKGNIDILMQLIAAWEISRFGEDSANPPFRDGKQMNDVIDSIPLGDVPWEGFKVRYNGDVPANAAPSWMTKEYEVWYRNPLDVMESQIGNPDFAHEQDYSPKQLMGQNKLRQYTDFMSAQWAWDQAVSPSQHL
jgi:Plavaka transposase